jgi:peptidoglycan/xylan/chitin deacetylase (PgdA/CDA1 family)
MLKKILFGLFTLVLCVLSVVYWCYSDVVFRAAVNEKVVAITFDDGPNPPYTAALLDMLARYNVPATFFMKGKNVEAFPNDVLAVANAGHEIGNHSYYHKPMLAFSAAAYVEEISRTNRALADILGQAPRLFRPPYGAQGIGLTLALQELGMDSIGMNAIGNDWELTDPEAIAAAILDNIGPGAIILLHDGHADVDDPHAQNSRAASVFAAQLIIETLHSQGYRFVSTSELLAMSAL